MKILLIKQTSLGDVLHMTPVIRALKKWKPESEIDIVTDKRALGILKNNPYINKLYVLDIYKYEKEIFKSPLKFFSTIKEFFSHIKEVCFINKIFIIYFNYIIIIIKYNLNIYE